MEVKLRMRNNKRRKAAISDNIRLRLSADGIFR